MVKKIIFLVFASMVGVSMHGQVKVLAPKKAVQKVAPYDSLVTFLPVSQIEAWIGQSLFIKPKSETSREYGYGYFYTEPKSDNESVFSPNKQYGFRRTKYDALAGRTFKVEGVILTDDKDFETKYLKLVDGADTIYYKYSTLTFEGELPFLVTGYVEKLNQLYVGQSYYLFKQPDEYWTDFETGEKVKLVPGSLWKCVDIVLDGEYYLGMLCIMKNEKGETISDYMPNVIDEVDFLSKKEGDLYRKKYGAAAFRKGINTLR